MTTESQIEHTKLDHVLVLKLNRAKALNALSLGMVTELYELLKNAEQDAQVQAVVLCSALDHFCAGGDVRKVRQLVLDNQLDQAKAFFEVEYALNLLIRTCKKPVIALAKGYVMGGGLGLFASSSFAVAHSNIKAAMPEVSIGLFPDVGASRFLVESGLGLGQLAGMSGKMLSAAELIKLGLATHVSELDSRSLIETLNLSLDPKALEAAQGLSAHDQIQAVLDERCQSDTQTSTDPEDSTLKGETGQLEADFEAALKRIEHLASHSPSWAQALESLKQGSAQAVALSFVLGLWAKNKPWSQVFELEHKVASFQVQQNDFLEGVRARLVDKTMDANWSHELSQPLSSILPKLPDYADPDWQTLLDSLGIQRI